MYVFIYLLQKEPTGSVVDTAPGFDKPFHCSKSKNKFITLIWCRFGEDKSTPSQKDAVRTGVHTCTCSGNNNLGRAPVNISFRVGHTASESMSMSIKLAIMTWKRGGAWKERWDLLYLSENERFGLWPCGEQGDESSGGSEESVTDRWDDWWLSDWQIRHSQHSLSQFKRNWITRETEATGGRFQDWTTYRLLFFRLEIIAFFIVITDLLKQVYLCNDV